MTVPLQVVFHGLDRSDAIERRIFERTEELERFHDRIIKCRVVVEAPHKSHRRGRLYKVKIDLELPKGEIVVDRAGPADHAHEDVYVAIRDAFDAASRRLEDFARKRRGDVKSHGEEIRITSRNPVEPPKRRGGAD